MKKYISLVCGIICLGQAMGQSEKANESYKSYDYQKAIKLYTNQIDDDTNVDVNILEKLANSYYFNADFNNAEEWYRKLFDKGNAEVASESYFRFSQSLKANKKYVEADKWMERFVQSEPNDSRAKRFVETKNYLEKIAENGGRFTLEPQSFNTNNNDFAPSFYGENLLVSSGGSLIGFQVKKHLWNNETLYDLYEVVPNKQDEIKKSRRKKLKGINTRLHESSSVVTKDGNTMYFTRNNLYDGKKGEDSDGNTLLKLYKATKNENGKWDAITPLPFNSETFSTGHPALSDDEKTLYFTSDRPGGVGSSDIYRVSIKDNNSYGDIENLGPTVNTEGRESFPFVTKSNKLFFASDGFYGLGGLDVFVTDLDQITITENNALVYNVGEPINSPKDDFSFIINEDTNMGYFASNRDGGQGGDDIYGFVRTGEIETTCDGGINGLAFETHFQKPLSGATLKLINAKGEEVASTISDAQGKFTFDASCANEAYKIVGSKEGHKSGESSFSLSRENNRPDVQVDLLELPPYKGEDIAKLLNLRPIYFALNKAAIRKSEVPELMKVLNYMKENPTVKIEIRSHTDSRGSDSYNLKLSDRRAKSTAKWIVDQGIPADRISGKGFGESQLLNQCSNGVKCNDATHEENRRSEFIVVSK
ncbi:OmpA family protein [Spongiivirga citrea]|uniref:OmpA family protein n=1 Tax=Spongiivirga citrea TaxID=1481457 RepID=A0A6M0CK26_9FLAO|nr:OmpA family protein [Spongiivirga citrea]NER16279.1 OmpA family protein [Spongiivirga citrea]